MSQSGFYNFYIFILPLILFFIVLAENNSGFPVLSDVNYNYHRDFDNQLGEQILAFTDIVRHHRVLISFLFSQELSLNLVIQEAHAIESPLQSAIYTKATVDKDNQNIIFVSSNNNNPTVNDPNLKVELVVGGLNFPTNMAFLEKEDILVLEKNNGQVRRVIEGRLQPEPILDVEVANKIERGLLGIDISKINDDEGNNKTYVYLFFTESTEDGNDECYGATVCNEDTEPLGNRLYRYEFDGETLVNPKLLLDLPAGPGADHNGGVLKIGPEGNIYILVGDGDSCWEDEFCTGSFEDSPVNSETSNVPTGDSPVGRGGILRITSEGEPVFGGKDNETGILAEHDPLNKYFAYGIRNGYGLAFDPITGILWDTENGPGYGDEINIVEPGFNSGWLRVQGWWHVEDADPLPDNRGYFEDNIIDEPENLETFADKGRYSSPEFVWNMSVGVTALNFLTSDELGKQYEYDLFVADYNNDYLYNFNLNENRTEFSLSSDLADKTANSNDELKEVVFGKGFGVITDIEVGPDGYLYLLSHGHGNIYRIVPR